MMIRGKHLCIETMMIFMIWERWCSLLYLLWWHRLCRGRTRRQRKSGLRKGNDCTSGFCMLFRSLRYWKLARFLWILLRCLMWMSTDRRQRSFRRIRCSILCRWKGKWMFKQCFKTRVSPPELKNSPRITTKKRKKQLTNQNKSTKSLSN